MKYVLTALFFLSAVSITSAQAPASAPSCQDQLKEVTLQTYNLDADRDQKERQVAKVQAYAHGLEIKVAELNKQIADLKKTLEPKVEKKAE